MILNKFFQKCPKIKTLSFYCITLAFICQAFSAPAGAITASSSANNFYFDSFEADYYLSKADDGTSRLRVVEKFVAIFPNLDQNHGITRIIPFTNQDGKNLTMASDHNLDIKIKHNGIPEQPYKIEANDGYFTVYIGSPDDYVRNEQIYELEYEFRNVIISADTATICNSQNCTSLDQPQELYWDTNGNDWQQRFSSLVARVHFADSELAEAYSGQVSCYVGYYGDKGANRCQITKITDGIAFRAQNLQAGENLTFDLEFAPQTFVIPSYTYDYRVVWFAGVEVILLIILGIIIFIIRRQTRAKRDFYHDLFVTPEYAPAPGFTVAEMATNYVGKCVLRSSQVATLLELAVSGKIELIKVSTAKRPQWAFKILSTDLSLEQADVLKLLIGHDEPLKADNEEHLIQQRTNNSTLTRLALDYGQHTKARLQEARLLEEKPHTGLCTLLLVGGIIWVIVVISLLTMMLDESTVFDKIPSYVILFGGGWLIAGVIIGAIVLAIIAFASQSYYRKFYTHTEAGLKWSKYLDGLRLYIKMAEQDRLQFLQSVDNVDLSHQGIAKLYEKLLPYAALFNLETSWLKELGKYYEMKDVAEPTWYVSGAVFSAQNFSHDIHAASTATAIVSQSHSGTSGSSSSSSGGSGGGFSGGGGGGGGGGGW